MTSKEPDLLIRYLDKEGSETVNLGISGTITGLILENMSPSRVTCSSFCGLTLEHEV